MRLNAGGSKPLHISVKYDAWVKRYFFAHPEKSCTGYALIRKAQSTFPSMTIRDLAESFGRLQNADVLVSHQDMHGSGSHVYRLNDEYKAKALEQKAQESA